MGAHTRSAPCFANPSRAHTHTRARVRTCTDSRIHTHAHMRARPHTRTHALPWNRSHAEGQGQKCSGWHRRPAHTCAREHRAQQPPGEGRLTPLAVSGAPQGDPRLGRKEAGAEPQEPDSRVVTPAGFLSASTAGIGADAPRWSPRGAPQCRRCGPCSVPPPPAAQRPPHARAPGAQASWPGPNLPGLITPCSVIISGARRDGRRGKVRSAVDVGQGAGRKQLPSSLERASALGLWQKLGLSGLKPGRGELSGVRARPSGWSIRCSFLSRHFHRLFVSNPSNSLLRLLLTNSVPTARLRRRQSAHFCLRLGLSQVLPIWGNSFPGHLCSLGPVSASEFSQGHSHLPVLSRRRKKREAREGEGTPLPHGTAGSIQKP